MITLPLHFPLGLTINGQSYDLHGIFEFIGIFTAFRYYLYLKKKKGDAITDSNRIWIVIAATFGAVLGARVLGTMENLPDFFSSSDKLKYFWGNKTLAGGLLGGLITVELAKKLIGEKKNSGDLFVYPLLLGMIIGRIGCFSAGIYEETYGLPTSLPWGMNLGDGVYRHPVTLYEILFLLLIWVGLKQLQKHYVLQNGALFKLFIIGYMVFRLLLDFIKPGWRYFFGLGSIQLASLAGLIYYYRYILNPSLLIKNKIAHAG